MSDIQPSRPGLSTTVLLIDAFEDDRQYWVHRLHISAPDYVVLEADTGAAGLALCESHPVHCVALELNLPDMPGFEVLIKLVPRPLHPQIAVIVLSRVEHLSIAELAEDNGAQAFLFKSHTSGDQLITAIDRAIARVGSTTKEQVDAAGGRSIRVRRS